MQEVFQIGWGEVDITPDNAKVELAGQYYQRMATGVHSRLKAVVLALEKGEQKAIMIALDVVGIPAELQQAVQAAVHQQLPEIAPWQIFLNAIHTHNAPYVRPAGLFRDWLPLDPDALDPAEYVKFLQQQILRAVQDAWNNRQPGGIQPAFGTARIGHCRRAVYADGTAEMYGDTTREDFVGMEAGEDSGVEILFTYTAAGQVSGAMINVACPSQVMEAQYQISSDFMGAARELLRQHFGADFHVHCQVSAAGCQSPRDLVRNFRSELDFWHADGVPVLAERLSTAVINAFSQATVAPDMQPIFRHECHRVNLPRRRAAYQDYRQARENLARLLQTMPEKEAFADFCRETFANEKIPGRPGPFDSKLHHFVLIQNNKAVIKRYQTQDCEPTFAFDMQVLRLGEVALVNNPFELYLLFGQIIKARSPARQTFVVQLSGGSGGYLPSPDAERYGGYGGLIINGNVGSDGGFLLADTAVKAIRKLF